MKADERVGAVDKSNTWDLIDEALNEYETEQSDKLASLMMV